MKRFALILTVAVLVAGVAFGASIRNSKHDLSSTSTGGGTYKATNTNEVCVFCHTPHGARVAGAPNYLPLWNRTAPTSNSYGVYTSVTMNANMTTADFGGSTNSTSALCMGCHDGTVGVGTLIVPPKDAGGNALTNAATMVTGVANLGNTNTALTNDHPVNFTYDTALATADGGLYNPANTTAVSNLLFGGTVQCASCHDVHDPANVPFLRLSNGGSALCLTCHIK